VVSSKYRWYFPSCMTLTSPYLTTDYLSASSPVAYCLTTSPFQPRSMHRHSMNMRTPTLTGRSPRWSSQCTILRLTAQPTNRPGVRLHKLKMPNRKVTLLCVWWTTLGNLHIFVHPFVLMWSCSFKPLMGWPIQLAGGILRPSLFYFKVRTRQQGTPAEGCMNVRTRTWDVVYQGHGAIKVPPFLSLRRSIHHALVLPLS
jgi:hypothetical protein